MRWLGEWRRHPRPQCHAPWLHLNHIYLSPFLSFSSACSNWPSSLLPSSLPPSFLFSYLFFSILKVIPVSSECTVGSKNSRSSIDLQLTQPLLWATHTWTHWLLLTRTNVWKDPIAPEKAEYSRGTRGTCGSLTDNLGPAGSACDNFLMLDAACQCLVVDTMCSGPLFSPATGGHLHTVNRSGRSYQNPLNAKALLFLNSRPEGSA